MAKAMISAATPAATPTIEIRVIREITACLRLALRYRIATRSSNFTLPSNAGTESRLGLMSNWSATLLNDLCRYPHLLSEAYRNSKHECSHRPSHALLHLRVRARAIEPENVRAD